MAREAGGESDLTYVYSNRNAQPTAEVSAYSLKCLQPSKYLNDEVVQFYTAYLINQSPKDLVRKIHVFDNIFHKLLVETFETDLKEARAKAEAEARADGQKGGIADQLLDENASPINVAKWRNLDKWFNGIDIFEKDFLVFPVCKDEHWFAIIVCYPSEVHDFNLIDPSPASTDARNEPKPGIIVLDSLGLNNQIITKHVRDFLDYEWRTRLTVIKDFHFHNMPQFHPQLPKQTNAFDCGVFLLAYLTAFFKNPERFYRLVRKNENRVSDALTSSVNDALAECSRESVRSLIQKHCVVKRHANNGGK